MTKTSLIALGGYLRAGKDEVANHLAQKHQYSPMGMSDDLNKALQRIGPKGPWVRVDFDVYPDSSVRGLYRGKYHRGEYVRYNELLHAVGYVETKRHRDAREYLQGLGTEVGREMIDQDVWVNLAAEKILDNAARGENTVITAIRFPNEIDLVRSLGGHLVWIDREEARKNAEAVTHASENSVSMEDFDYVLDNNSSLEKLYSETDRLLEELSKLDEPEPVVTHQGFWK